MYSRKYSMYSFFPIPEDVFILCIGFFYRFWKMFFEAEIIDYIFYVSHRDYIYIYINRKKNVYIVHFNIIFTL